MSNIGTGTSGTVLQGNGTGKSPAYSTATYPATATSTGTILRADGTNWVATTTTYPNTNAVNTLLYASSANVMSALATANNSVLVTNSSGVPSWGSGATVGSSLVLIQSQTASSSATLDFTTGLSSYDTIFVTLQGVKPATNSVDLQMLITTNGGSTWAGAGSYAAGINYNKYNVATLTNANSTANFVLGKVILNSQTITGFLYCINFANGSAVQVTGQTCWNDTANIAIGIPMGQALANTNGLRFLMSSGNIASGTISLYGLKNS